MAVAFPKLPFSLGALEPYMSKKTISFHYGKHHKNYVTTLNRLIENTPYDKMSLREIIFESHRKPGDEKIYNNASQSWNHSFFWNCLTPKLGQRPGIKTLHLLNEKFGSLQNFKENFISDAMEVFGSGWAWLVKNGNSVTIECRPNADSPVTYKEDALLCCDLWEHAYYLDYQNDRRKFLDQFLKIVNWEFIEEGLINSEVPTANYSAQSQIDRDLRV